MIARRKEGPMARNRFEQVDELQPDAINLTLTQKATVRSASFIARRPLLRICPTIW